MSSTTLEDQYKTALEAIGATACSCSERGTCASCEARFALRPAQQMAEDTAKIEPFTITIDGYDRDPSMVINVERTDGKFPLSSFDGQSAVQEATLRLLGVVLETLSKQDKFTENLAFWGLKLRVDRIMNE